MRRVLSVAILGAAVFVGTLITPGGRVSAEKAADPVLVTNIPLPVTVGNFPATQAVAGTVGAAQSGDWTAKLATPRLFAGREIVTIPDGAFGVSGGGTFIAPADALIETITARIQLPTGQNPELAMLLPDDSGRIVGAVWVPLQFQATSPAGRLLRRNGDERALTDGSHGRWAAGELRDQPRQQPRSRHRSSDRHRPAGVLGGDLRFSPPGCMEGAHVESLDDSRLMPAIV